MTSVLLGNVAPRMADGTPADIGNTITVVGMRDGWDDQDEVDLALSTPNDQTLNLIARVLNDSDRKYAIGLLEIHSLWTGAHSDDPPEWVESDDENFARVIADFYSVAGHTCTVGRPDDWTMSADVEAALDAMTPPDDPPAGRPLIGGGSEDWDRLCELAGVDPLDPSLWRAEHLLVNAGRDALHAQHVGTAAQPAAFNYMAVSASAVAASAANTTLPGEITTAGGGLVRAQATHAHTAGTNTSTLTKTFTANGSDALPVTLAKIGVFNASSGGTLGYETLMTPSTSTLSASGDSVALTHTLTAG